MDRPALVTDEQIHDCLEYLRKSALDVADARQRAIKATHMIKVVRAIVMAQHNDKSAAKAEVIAMSSQKYREAVDEDAIASAELEKIRSLRDAASMKIEVWRTASSNIRAAARL
jgi:hypothetical protein